jgi:hypothetical protein
MLEIYKMNKKIFSFLVVLSLLICFNNIAPCESNTNHKKKFKVDVNLEEQKRLQSEVDNGHQPWRLEPIDVALASLTDIDKNIKYENCKLGSKTNSKADVICRGAKHYLVNLKRMIRSDGIWTAVSIEEYK